MQARKMKVTKERAWVSPILKIDFTGMNAEFVLVRIYNNRRVDLLGE